MNGLSTAPAADRSPEGTSGMPGNQPATIDYRFELVRKSIHLCSLSIPIIYYLVPKSQALWMLGPVTAAFLIIDITRHYLLSVSRWFYSWFGWLLRRHEQDGIRKRLNGATYVLVSAMICVLAFPKIITVTAFAVLIISDTTSALIGRKFGKRRFFKKSLEGSVAFFVSAVLVVLVSPKIHYMGLEYAIGIVGAAVGMFVESISGKIDDNLTIPVSIGLVMWACYALFLPGVDVYSLG